ncbi:MAG: hypothetical protein HYX94_09950 [Chloroflexi bacterium]|nr:hypothetical protein [Chloroflexota bacterium]
MFISAKHFNLISSIDSLVRRFLDRMVLRDVQLQSLEIHGAWFPSFLFSMGETIIIDWSAAIYVLAAILQPASRKPETRNLKGRHFETTLGKWLQTKAPHLQYLFGPNKKLRYDGRVLAEMDLSFQQRNVGYVVDCKAYDVSVQLLLGDVDAVNTRWSYADEWISGCLKRTKLLAEKPVGNNYRLNESVEYLIPLVCSAYIEPVESLEERYLVAPKLPRVCTPLELVDILDSTSIDALISNPYTFRVERAE